MNFRDILRINSNELQGVQDITGGVIGLTGTTSVTLDAGGNLTFSLDNANGGIITDTRVTPIGLVYAADYSGTFTDESVVTKRYVDNQLGSTTIGDAPDLDYTDGLFTDFVPSTPVGTAVDRFNEVLKGLSPQPAPNLSDISINQTGTVGNLSFDTTNTIAGYSAVDGSGGSTITRNQIIGTGGTQRGIFADGTNKTGVIADGVTADPNNSYPDNAFGNGDQGTLRLFLNGVEIHSTDLTSFTSGNSLNGNGSGFTLSAPTFVQFQNGDDFEQFQYRTGTWIIDELDERNGYNYMQIQHDLGGGTVYNTNFFEWVVDAETTATTFSGESFTAQNFVTGKSLSGVTYYGSGTLDYSVTVSNVYRNTYSDAANAVQITGANIVNENKALTVITTDETQDFVISDEQVTVSATRLLNQPVTVRTTALRTVQATQQSAGATLSNILLDATVASPTVLSEDFEGELYRVPSDENFDLTTTAVTGSWDSTLSLVGADLGVNTGLQLYGGQLVYPDVNFSTITNAPAGNPDYSAATGERTYYRFFDTGSTGTGRFDLTLTGNYTVVNEDATFTASSNEVKISIKLPTETAWLDVNKAFVPGNFSTDGDGTREAGNNFVEGSANTLSVGTANTANSDFKIFIRITAPDGWTGNINDITITLP